MRVAIKKKEFVDRWWQDVLKAGAQLHTLNDNAKWQTAVPLDDLFKAFGTWCVWNISPTFHENFTRIGFQMLLLEVAKPDGASSAKHVVEGKPTRVVKFKELNRQEN